MPDWTHKDEWRRYGEGFLVTVTRHAVEAGSGQGPHRWAVYVYIYPAHPLFQQFDGTDMWQPATIDLPLHAGPSFLQRHRNDAGDVTSYQVGADYNHLYDDHYSYCATKEDAPHVFRDAEALFNHLTNPASELEVQP